AVDLEAGTVRLATAEKLAGRVHARLGRLLGPPDAGDLGRVLGAAAPVEELAVGLQLDPVLPEEVGESQREEPRDDRARQLPAPAGAERELEDDLLPGQALRDQLVEAELLGRHDVVVAQLTDASRLELVDEDQAPAVLLGVDERIADSDRH